MGVFLFESGDRDLFEVDHRGPILILGPSPLG
jgi:hypothetical protein